MIVLIPAYEPDHRLVALVRDIRDAAPDQRIVVVDDGSGPDHASVFAAARHVGAEVIGHPHNRGKGFALKQGFAHVVAHHPGHDVVTADCDGQHRLDDIRRVAARLRGDDRAVVLGARGFTGEVPARSRFGNALTRIVFRALTGLALRDTQTGLRGYPASLLAWLATVDGDRFEYELEVLLAARRAGIPLVEVPIATVYLDGNRSSHFDPVRDSIRVFLPLVRFGLSSIVAFVVDTILFFALVAATGSLGVSVVGARVASASLNFVVNDRFVFHGNRSRADAAWRYGSLAVVLLAANYALLRVLTGPLAVPLVAAKLGTEGTLFLVSFAVQRASVFRRRRPAADVVVLAAGRETPEPSPEPLRILSGGSQVPRGHWEA